MTAMIDRARGIVAAPDAFGSELDSEVVLMSIAKGNYFILNPIAGDIWTILSQSDTPVSIADIADRLYERYAGDRTTIENDTAQLVGQLIDKELAKFN